MVVYLSSRRPALPGHSGASLTQLEILGSCVIFLESEREDFLNLVVSDSSWQSVTTSPGRLMDVSADERTKQWRETDVCSKRARHPFFQLQNSKPLKGSGYSSFWLEAKQPPKFENFDPKVCPLGPQVEPQWDVKVAAWDFEGGQTDLEASRNDRKPAIPHPNTIQDMMFGQWTFFVGHSL